MSNEWDAFAENWDVDASVQAYADKAFAALLTVLNPDGLSVFDFGCGTGALTQRLSPRVKEVVALDGSSEMIKRLTQKQLENVSAISGFLTQDLIMHHPLLSQRFDLIVASSVCGFLPDYIETLGRLKSLLKIGGLFVQWDWLSDEHSGKGLTEYTVQQALHTNGFVDIQLKVPFEMPNSNGTLKVLMAVGVRA